VTEEQRINSARGRYAAALARTADVQKTAKGAPAYSRLVNRRLGRYLAAGAYVLNMTPNQVTLVSACFSYAAIAAVALLEPTPAMSLVVTLGLALGYALDSADGQLARLRGGGSAAGEWLDHMIDCVKISALHLAVLVSFYRFFPLDHSWYLLLPAGFLLVANVFFFGTILTDQLRRAHRSRGLPLDAEPEPASLLRAFLVVPTDYGLMCLTFLFLSYSDVFMLLYGLLFLGTSLFLAAVCVKWYREITLFDRPPSAGSNA
jgi:phosphatidylserine synthase